MDLSLGWGEQMVDQFQGGGFSGTAAAKKNQSLAALDLEIQVHHEGQVGWKAIGDVAEFDSRAEVARGVHTEPDVGDRMVDANCYRPRQASR